MDAPTPPRPPTPPAPPLPVAAQPGRPAPGPGAGTAPPQGPDTVPLAVQAPAETQPQALAPLTAQRWSRPGLSAALWFLALAVFLFMWPYVAYTVAPPQGRFLVSSMLAALIGAVAALGLNVISGYTGMLSLGHAVFMAVGAYMMIRLAGPVLPAWVAAAAAILIGAAVGTFVAIFCVHLRGLYLAVATFLVVAAVRPLGELFPSFFGGQQGARPEERLQGLYPEPGASDMAFAPSEAFQIRFYMFCALVVIVVMVLLRNLVRSRWGRAWMAVRDGDLGAKAAGVHVPRFRIVAFATSAALAAFAGVLFSQNPSQAVVKESNFTFLVSFQLVFMVVFGGPGTVAGPFLGAVMLGVVFPILLKVTGLDEVPGLYGILVGWVLVATVIAMPDGLVGRVRTLWARLARSRARRGRSGRAPRPPEPRDEDRLPRPSHPPTGHDASLLELRDLSVQFGGLRAVDGVDLAVAPGTIHAVIGPNGSGKTTLVNAITGFYAPATGTVVFRGTDVTGRRPDQLAALGIARTFQNLQIWRRMTVLENVMVGMHPRTRAGFVVSLLASFALREERSVRRRAYGLLQFVGLAERAWEPAGSLPLAEQRRLEIARALASDPDVLCLDEPAAGTNPSEARDLMHLVRRVNESGITVVLIEHHIDVVMALSHRVTVLDYGHKIAEGTPAEVQTDPEVATAYLGTTAPADAHAPRS